MEEKNGRWMTRFTANFSSPEPGEYVAKAEWNGGEATANILIYENDNLRSFSAKRVGRVRHCH